MPRPGISSFQVGRPYSHAFPRTLSSNRKGRAASVVCFTRASKRVHDTDFVHLGGLMNGFRSLVGAAIAASFALFALPAAADTQTLEGGCEFRGGVDCTGSCKLGFDAACNVQLAAS